MRLRLDDWYSCCDAIEANTRPRVRFLDFLYDMS